MQLINQQGVNSSLIIEGNIMKFLLKPLVLFYHLFIITVIILAAENDVNANELTNHGFTSRSTAMAGAVTADVKDASALYYNPAGLGDAENAVQADINISVNALAIELFTKNKSNNVPELVYDTTPIDPTAASLFPSVATGAHPNKRASTKNKEISTSLVLGLTLNPGIKWINFALATFIPLQKVHTSTSYPDGREQHFSNQLNFSTLSQQAPGPIFMIGAGLKPLRWLKIGVTMLMYRRNTMHYNALLTDPSKDNTAMLSQVNMESSIVPGFNVGLQIEPHEKFGIGISYRHRMFTGQTVISNIETNDYSTASPPPGESRFIQDIEFVTDYNPGDLSLGLRIGNHCPWVLNIDATWRMWSKYDSVGDESARKEFHDVVIPKLAFEYEINGRLDLRLGTSYILNPVYKQDGETNFVDNDRVQIAIGTGIDLPWPPNAHLDLHVQLFFLIPRTFDKQNANMIDEFPESVNNETGELVGDNSLQTNNPGYPGYESSGIIASFGAAVKIPF